MTRAAVFGLLLLAAPAFAQQGTSSQPPPADARCHPLTEVDGDSAILPLSGGTVTGIRLRILGIDTPELRGRCPEERAKAQEARDTFARLASPCAKVTTDFRTDAYGRVLARVFTRDGREIGPILIGMGLARAYDGTGPRGSWCPAP